MKLANSVLEASLESRKILLMKLLQIFDKKNTSLLLTVFSRFICDVIIPW